MAHSARWEGMAPPGPKGILSGGGQGGRFSRRRSGSEGARGGCARRAEMACGT